MAHRSGPASQLQAWRLRMPHQVWAAGFTPSREPVRNTITRSSNRVKISIRSRKANRMIDCESAHERNFILLCDIDPNVTEIYSQPFEWRGWMLGREHKHFPDLAIVACGIGEVHEVKTTKELQKDDKYEVRLAWTKWAEARGVPYLVPTEKCISPEILARAVSLQRYARPNYSEITALHAATALEVSQLTIEELISRLAGHNLRWEQVYSMAYNQQLFIDMSSDISLKSLVRYPDFGDLPPRIVPFSRLSEAENR